MIKSDIKKVVKKKLYIPIILGTAREGRHSEKVAKFMLKETLKADVFTMNYLFF